MSRFRRKSKTKLKFCDLFKMRIRISTCGLSSPTNKNLGSLMSNFGARMNRFIHCSIFRCTLPFPETQMEFRKCSKVKLGKRHVFIATMPMISPCKEPEPCNCKLEKPLDMSLKRCLDLFSLPFLWPFWAHQLSKTNFNSRVSFLCDLT